MYVGQRVRLPDLERGKGCFRACTCTHARRMEYCSDLPCMDQYRNCGVAGQIKGECYVCNYHTLKWQSILSISAHGTNFVIDCNFCSCYNGEVTCTKRQCTDVYGGASTRPVLPCNCNSHHLPVCAASGRTFPNICLAKCMGYDQSEIEFGPCSVKDPCKARPCKRGEMWEFVHLSTLEGYRSTLLPVPSEHTECDLYWLTECVINSPFYEQSIQIGINLLEWIHLTFHQLPFLALSLEAHHA